MLYITQQLFSPPLKSYLSLWVGVEALGDFKKKKKKKEKPSTLFVSADHR